MSTLNGSEARLNAAIERLEQAVTAQKTRIVAEMADHSDGDHPHADEVLALRQECSELQSALASAQENEANLRAGGRALIEDLDQTIGEIDAMMER